MGKNYFKKCVFLTIVLFSLHIVAQEKHETHKPFRISPILSHSYIPAATSHGNEYFIVPSFGLDLEYWFSHKWGIGFHNDLTLQTFQIKNESGTETERETPLIVTVDGLYRFHKGWVLVAGAGIEFEKHENLKIIRIGLEYEIELGNHWDVAPTILYDFRSGNFGTYSIGIGFGKRF